MKTIYKNYVGKMKCKLIQPMPHLLPFIESYTFFENTSVKKKSYVKLLSNGKIEILLLPPSSHLIAQCSQSEVKVSNILLGMSDMNTRFKIATDSQQGTLSGILINLTPEGAWQLFQCSVLSVTNKILALDEIAKPNLYKLLSAVFNNLEKKNQAIALDHVFDGLLSKKKKPGMHKFNSS